jgi:hypothetical protein
MYENRILPVIRPDFVTETLPGYFTTDYPHLVLFLQYYYESLDSDGGFGDILKDLYSISNIGLTDLKYLDSLFYELGLNVSKDLFKNPREVLRSMAEFFRTKGSEQSLKQFFRMFYNSEAKVSYPKDEIFLLNDNTSLLDDPLKKIQDGKLYQVLSLMITSPIGYKEYEELYKKFVHPAGFYIGALAQVHSDAIASPSGFQDPNIVDNSNKIFNEKIIVPTINVNPILKSDIGNSDVIVFDGQTTQGVVGNTFLHDYDTAEHYTDEKWFLTAENVDVPVPDGGPAAGPSAIFNTWYRFSHSTSGIYPANSSETLAWVYNQPSDSIICTLNTVTYVGFISELSETDFNISADLSSTGADNDTIAIIIAFVTDNTREYTLSAVRTMGGTPPTGGWGIYYNYAQSDARLIASYGVPFTAGGWSANGPTKVSVVKSGSIITATTSQNGSTTLDPNTALIIDLSGDPDLQKFAGDVKNGYAALSQDAASFSNIENNLQPEPVVHGGSGYQSILETAGHNVRTALRDGYHNPRDINIAALDPYKTLKSEDTLYPPSLEGFDPNAGYSIFEAAPNKIGIIQILNIAASSTSIRTVDLKSLWGYSAEKIIRKDSQKFITRAYIRGDFQSTNDLRIYGLNDNPNRAFVVGDNTFNNTFLSFTQDNELPVINIDNFIDSDGVLELSLQNTGTGAVDLALVFAYKYNTIYDWIKYDSNAVFDINSFVYADNRNIRDVGIQEIMNKNILYLKDTII